MPLVSPCLFISIQNPVEAGSLGKKVVRIRQPDRGKNQPEADEEAWDEQDGGEGKQDSGQEDEEDEEDEEVTVYKPVCSCQCSVPTRSEVMH